MIQFFEWIAAQNPNQAWGLFALICAFMAFMPYAKVSFKYLRLLFSNQKTEIVDFSWRVSKDHYLLKSKGMKYYLNASKQNFLLEGGKLLLNWHVTGAYRIDVLPIGKKLKGNSAVIAAKRSQNHFKLIAHTTKGKLEKELVINPDLFRDLGTVNLSREDHFKQQSHVSKTIAYTDANILLGRYSSRKLGNLSKFRTHTLCSHTQRMNCLKGISNLNALVDRNLWKAAKSRYLRTKKFPIVAFHPLKYNQALESYKNEESICN